MKTTRNKYYLLNFIFLGCLLILLVNDHCLKYEFANPLTGKLSDIAGIIMLPQLLAFIFPKLKLHAIWISALLFTFWKSPYSQSLINFYNQYTFIQTSRIVDYTDLYVLLLLPLPYFVIKRIDRLSSIKIKNVHPVLLLAPTLLALMATTPPESYYYTRTEGNLYCNNCNITVDYSQEEIIEKLRKHGIIFNHIKPMDKFVLERTRNLINENAHIYKLNQLVIDKDTLRNLDFTMRTIKNGKTKIHFNGLLVSEDISTPKLKRKLAKYYKKILLKELNNKLAE